jgi:thioredoxin-dependent peroxiredoxin
LGADVEGTMAKTARHSTPAVRDSPPCARVRGTFAPLPDIQPVNKPLPGGGLEGGVMHFLAIVLFALAFMVGMPLMARAADLPKVGDVARDFTLPSQEGAPVQLSKLRGQWVVLYFYPKDMTQGCTLEAHNFARDQAEYAARNAIVLGVSVDGIDSHKKFCTQENLNFRLLADTEKRVAGAYGSLNNFLVVKVAARHTFLIDPQGKIARVFADVKPASHSQEVLAALDGLVPIPQKHAAVAK